MDTCDICQSPAVAEMISARTVGSLTTVGALRVDFVCGNVACVAALAKRNEHRYPYIKLFPLTEEETPKKE
jgi:hypothetical protein